MDYRLVFGSTTPLCCGDIRKDWFDDALIVLKRDGSDAWAVQLKGT